ncbi:T9SS type A sorting domain-containing protein [Nibribacter koreensis]
MKLKKTTLVALMMLGFGAVIVPAQAQTPVKGTLALADTNAKKGPEKVIRRETLSGIDLYEEKGKSKDFMLSFQQNLVEDGVLTVANSAGKVLFTKSLTAGDHTLAPPMNLGALRNGVYLVEVKTGNTIYWKKLRIKP